MKCFQCRQRKGKRFCPATNSEICPQCCGEKRVVEISCPSDCQFLKSGQAYHWLKNYVGLLQAEQDPARRQRLYQTRERFHELLSRIEEIIVSYSASLTSITDPDVREAIVSLKSTYRTEQKGLIYEHASSNPLAQALVRQLRSFLEQYRSESADQGNSVRITDLIDCLEFIEVDVNYHLTNKSGKRSYLQFAARNHPAVTIADQKGIILTP